MTGKNIQLRQYMWSAGDFRFVKACQKFGCNRETSEMLGAVSKMLPMSKYGFG